MPWLARLDTRATCWPLPAYLCYLAVKASLIVIGAIALGRVYLDRLGLWPFFP